jgi:predicted RNase H-like nuclease
VLARTVLKKRASSVFPIPCRKALQASEYKDASNINYQESGKKLSLQSWNISPMMTCNSPWKSSIPTTQKKMNIEE